MVISDIGTTANYKLSPDLQQRIKARNRLADLAKPEGELVYYPDGRVYRNDELIGEEPDDFQNEWVLFRLSLSNTWPNVHENKIGNYKNWK
jgi:hypothetical protein